MYFACNSWSECLPTVYPVGLPCLAFCQKLMITINGRPDITAQGSCLVTDPTTRLHSLTGCLYICGVCVCLCVRTYCSHLCARTMDTFQWSSVSHCSIAY